MNLRPDQPPPCTDSSSHRLNLLLSVPRWREGTAVDHLPPLLSPMGINTLRAASGEEAADLIRTVRVHIAVVDLTVPLQRACRETEMPAASSEGGSRILQLLRRMDQPPPVVVVRPAQPAQKESARSLTEALREGAFAVLDQPVALEAMLEVMRRILRRHYAGLWPA
jgi:CheY-like chemotaxis protein